MAKLLFSGTHGSNDPTRAALPLLAAIGATDAGHDVEVFLLGEAAYLMKDEIAAAVNPVAFPNVGDMLHELIGRGVRFYI